MSPDRVRLLRRHVLDWYAEHGRRLAFRATRDPWAVLVSEVMAQQTQVARVEPAWTAFVARFGTARALAAAPPDAAVRAWAGLGYNGRAVRLHAAARQLVAEHAGRVPDDVAELARLPGIGTYTARAVAAIAFGRQVAAIDTNVRRVLGRVAGTDDRRQVEALATALVPAGRADEWTHAIMDLGATVCTPRRPACPTCPVRGFCRAAADGRPVAAPRRRSAAGEPFERTRRWLRGRIVERLRAVEPGTWEPFRDPIGGHGLPAVRAALAGLARDGLLEHDPGPPDRARLRPG